MTALWLCPKQAGGGLGADLSQVVVGEERRRGGVGVRGGRKREENKVYTALF